MKDDLALPICKRCHQLCRRGNRAIADRDPNNPRIPRGGLECRQPCPARLREFLSLSASVTLTPDYDLADPIPRLWQQRRQGMRETSRTHEYDRLARVFLRHAAQHNRARTGGHIAVTARNPIY